MSFANKASEVPFCIRPFRIRDTLTQPRMSVRVAAIAASIFGVLTLVACLVFVPILWNRVASIQAMVQTDMDEFNVRTSAFHLFYVPYLALVSAARR